MSEVLLNLVKKSRSIFCLFIIQKMADRWICDPHPLRLEKMPIYVSFLEIKANENARDIPSIMQLNLDELNILLK